MVTFLSLPMPNYFCLDVLSWFRGGQEIPSLRDPYILYCMMNEMRPKAHPP